ncbi:MAG: TonB-dependent receptor [Psychrobacter sp.]
MYQLQHLDYKNSAKQWKTQIKPSFVLNYIVSAKLAMSLSLVAGTVFICVPSAYAQTNANLTRSEQTIESGNGAKNPPLEDDSNVPTVTLPAITVVAERNDNPIYSGGQVTYTNHAGFLGNKDFLETPFSAISYTDKFIEDQQATDITAVIAATDPAVFSSGVGGQNLESYSIRGFSSDISDVTVGGLFGMAPFYRSSPEMFERIEVLKGPSALLNGMPPKGSVGGAVNLVPKRAGDEPLTRVTARYLSDSQLGGHMDVGRRFGEDKQFGVRVNGAYRDGDSAINDQEKQAQLASIALDWKGERARFSTDLYHSKERVDGPTRGLTLAPGLSIPKPPKPETLLNPSWAFNDSEDKGLMIRGEFDVTDDLMIYGAGGNSKTHFKGRNASVTQIINAAGDYRTNLGEVEEEIERKSAEIGLKSKFKTGRVNHQVAFNMVDYKEDNHLSGLRGILAEDWVTNIYKPVWESRNIPFNSPALLNTKTNLTSYGLADTLSFAEDKYQLTLGLRHQQVESKQAGMLASAKDYNESATTPSIALLGKVNDQFSLYANYIEGLSQGSTAPIDAENAGEMFAPYKTQQKEVGVKLDLGEFSHTLSVYEIEKPNSYLDPVSNIFSYAGEQRNRGVEWGFFGSPIEDIRLMGGVSYIDAKLTKTLGGVNEGNRATGVPQWQSKLGVEWDLPFIQDLTLTANANSVSKQYLDAGNSLSLPGRTVYDLGARYVTSIDKKPLTLRTSVANVTNKAYWAKPHYTSLGLGEPRTFMLSATMDF